MYTLLIVHALPCHRPGGLEFAAMAMIEGLVDRGHRIRVLTTGQQLAPPDHLASPRMMLKASGWDNTAHPEGTLALERLPGRCGHPSPTFWSAARSRARRLVLRGDEQGERPEAVVAVDLAPLLLDIPFVHQVHGTLLSETTLDRGFRAFRAQFPLATAWRRFWPRVAIAPMWRRTLRRASSVLVDSRFIARRLERRHPGIGPKVDVLQLALGPSRRRLFAGDSSVDDINDPAPTKPFADGNTSTVAFDNDRPLRLLSVGRLEPIKGHVIAAKALRNLAGRLRRAADTNDDFSPPFRWTVIGPRPASGDPLAPLFAELSEQPWFHHAGVVTDAELAEAYRTHDLLLNLEFNQPAFGLVVLEAMTAGATPIVSARGALPEVVTPWNKADLLRQHAMLPGYVVQAGDVDGLCDLLEGVIRRGRGPLETQRRITLEHAASFSFEHYMDELERHLGEHATVLSEWQAKRHFITG